ncbi:ribonuclease Z [Candidatus Micrarchaeota archaeon RBG_16_36_9]|nr:MAG: ribonuclease Z [Candidatus Micrarchaeota archaeon RBG_16_36_9]
MPEPINITFLGTGAAIPSLSRRHPAILLQYKGDYILFDCGEGTQLQMQKARVSPMKISKIFISHWHADHFAGLLPLIESLHLSRRKEPLDVYGPEASRFIDSIVELSYWGIGFEVKAHDCNEEKNIEKIFENEYFEIYAIKVKHSVPAFGYMLKEKDTWNIDVKKAKKLGLSGIKLKEIKQKGALKINNKTVKLEQIAKRREGRKIVYSGDTMPCEELFEFSKEADIMIHDGTFAESIGVERPHSSASETASLAKKYKIKKLILTHLSRRYKTSDEVLNAAKSIFKNTIVASDMMKIILR